jgi:hypothetical protein
MTPEWFHERIGRAVYSTTRFNAFEIFRGGAKTTLLRVFTAQRVCYAISRTILFISVSQGHSMITLRWLKRQVEHNTRWSQTFGLSKGDKWTDEWIEIKHGIDGIIITVLALGVTGQTRGFNPDDFRPDLIILDDVLSDENTATDAQRAKIEDLIFGAILKSLAPESEAPLAKAVLINTPFHDNDVISKAINDPQWNGIVVSCFDEKGESAWPERLPTKGLLADKEAHIRRGQYRLWMREMECKIVAGEDTAINVERLQFWDTLPEGMTKVLAIDPASSDSKTADDNVVMTVGFHGLDVYVLAYDAEKGVMPDKAAMHFFNQVLLFRPYKAVAEKVAYQRVLKWYIEQEMMKRRIFVPMDGVDDRRSKPDRIMQAIPGLVAYGHLYVHPSMTGLIDQMRDYNPSRSDQHDDMLDALAMAITAENPALRQTMIEGEYEVVDEDNTKLLTFGGCP